MRSVTPELELPRLTSADLIERFGNDEVALRRYRMLAALLREGRAPGEVARTFGVSRESLRRLREAFRHGGLAALKSRKRGGGHFVRNSPLARALRQELAAEPGIAANVLWRRVQARLRDEGILDVPRSTFYRLLARLRDEESGIGAQSATIRLLREALVALPEDPPLTLGRSDLAKLLLADETDIQQRGRRLQAALRAAIEQLRPPDDAGPVLNDPRWRHYLIIAGEYEAGETRVDLQEALALSASTYSRAKREALERLATLLPAAIEALPPPAPPAHFYTPPSASVVGYETELDLYVASLRRDSLALIWGDTEEAFALAAALASHLHTRGQKVIWHAAAPPDIEPRPGLRLLQTLAAALAAEGDDELWRHLALPEAIPQVWHLDLLANTIGGRRWTVVVANTHWLTDSDAVQTLDVLTTAYEQREIRLALAGRNLPLWADADRWPPLPGDQSALPEFLQRLARRTVTAQAPFSVEVVRERAMQLIDTLPINQVAFLQPDERDRLIAALAPVEQLLVTLRGAAGQMPP
ncbi:helix-turn-helix domain-containing protein [Roseiflexus sp.]|uniref:helix-turn-helix domain-containing protein n=1 Tax=Roseiflexus sp. TaxID=2562120 RepID=UPI0021DBE524|nr:helix-turn-helix domain-containing protein [Roseiflexus sp.]GIW00414.1 MAG: hypothetical protein KatS3mg058_1817 [Roseiflexus sp.]